MAVLRFERNQIYDIDDIAHTISTQQRLPVFVEKLYFAPMETAFTSFIVAPNLKEILNKMLKSMSQSEEVDFPDATDEPLHFNQRYVDSMINYTIYGLTDIQKKNMVVIYKKKAQQLAC